MASEGAKILIVDDDPAIVGFLKRMLEGHGFQTFEAMNGAEAVEVAKEKRPNLALLDIILPGMDGLEICKAFRKDTHHANMAIIMLTGKGGDSDIVQALECGADGYVMKPVVQEELFKTIQAMLAKAEKGELPSRFFLEKMKPSSSDSS